MDIQEFTSATGALVTFDKHALCCIAQVPIDFEDPAKIRMIGTGFYMFSNRIVITARHLFTHCDEDFGPHFVFNFGSNGLPGLAGFMAIPEVVHAHSRSDIAIVIVSEGHAPPMTPFLPGPHDHNPKEGFFSIGYRPSESVVAMDCWHAHVQIEHAAVARIEERQRTDVPAEFCVEYANAFAECGNSGGPLLNATGRVAGVVVEQFASVDSSSERAHRTMARATSLQPIIEILKQNPELPSIPLWLREWWFGERPERLPWPLPDA
jgi:S1-C subfamily serine protease